MTEEEFKEGIFVRLIRSRTIYKVLEVKKDISNKINKIKISPRHGFQYSYSGDKIKDFEQVTIENLNSKIILLNEDEHWKEISNYEGLYKISTEGRIALIDFFESERELVIDFYNCPKGIFPKVTLIKNGKKKIEMISDLIKCTFSEDIHKAFLDRCERIKNEFNLACYHKDEIRRWDPIFPKNVLTQEIIEDISINNFDKFQKRQVLFHKEYFVTSIEPFNPEGYKNYQSLKLTYLGFDECDLEIWRRHDKIEKFEITCLLQRNLTPSTVQVDPSFRAC